MAIAFYGTGGFLIALNQNELNKRNNDMQRKQQKEPTVFSALL